MCESNFEEMENSKTEMAAVAHLVKKVMQFGFGEVVVKVQDGKIVLLEERFTHKPDKGTNSPTQL